MSTYWWHTLALWVLCKCCESTVKVLRKCIDIFNIQIQYNAQRNTALKPQYLSQSKPRCIDSGVLNLHHDNDAKVVNPATHGKTQPIRKSEFVQCTKVE